ncbi:MAG: transposase [Bdellovibrionota bacterium]
MSTDLSYEHPEMAFFSTSRTMNSRLWFVNNASLHHSILTLLARYQELHEVIIYNFVIMGNHYHLLAKFPKMNKAAFFQDFNSMYARIIRRHVSQFEGGKLWGRPVRTQGVGSDQDIFDRFFYISLNPVGAGLCRRISDYHGYNGFEDAAEGRKRTFKFFNREDYNNRKRYNSRLTKSDCTVTHTLTFSRLPGFEHLSKSEYANMLRSELRRRELDAVKDRLAKGLGFATKEILLKLLPGSKPRTTKTSTRQSKRPLFLTSSKELMKQLLDWYFDVLARFRHASKLFRAGNMSVEFPSGTYRPFVQVS